MLGLVPGRVGSAPAGQGEGMFPVFQRASARNILVAIWLVVATPPAVAADSDWLTAREAFRRGDDAGLLAASQALAGSPLAAYGDYWMLWRRLKEASPADIRAFLALEQGSYLAEKLRTEWLRQLGRRQDWELFLQEYPALIDPTDSELRCLRLQAGLASGDTGGLGAARDTLWLTAKDQLAACDPVIEAMQTHGVIGEEDRWRRLRLALEAGASASGLARHLLRGLGVELGAEALKSIQDQPEAFIATADLSRRDQRELAAWAYGRWARRDFFPAAGQLEAQAESLAEQAPLAWRQVALAAARNFDPDVETWFARSERAEWTDNHREIRLRQLVRQGNWTVYSEQYGRLPQRLRDSRAWLYWQARALQAQGGRARANEARNLYNRLARDDDYYGLLAREAGGSAPAAVRSGHAGDADRERLAAHTGFRRAFALHALGQRWEAASEWNWAVRTADERLLLAAAERANELGWLDRSIYAAERAGELAGSQLLYPMPFRDVARSNAEAMSLDEAWIYGLIRQESRFVNVARSTAGAGGLMQLMPGTAQWVTGRLGIPWTPDMVNDVEQNIRLGTYYLNHVLAELGHPVLATAGYNAGPRRALEWQPGVEMEATRYIESIPFSETRDYVKKVMTNAVHYARILGQGETRLGTRLGMIPARTPTTIEGP